MSDVKLICGDCLEVMRGMADNSVDALVTDPPYMIDFMGKAFDTSKDNIAARPELWAEALRVAKPGAMLLAFGGTRTHHRLMCAIEDAGWEIRDCLMWLYGSGFPKGHDVSKAIDKHLGKERSEGERQWSGGQRSSGIMGDNHGTQQRTIYDTPATPEAAHWQGWNVALKPSWEPIIMARKPLIGTVAANVLAWGTGGINVDACRIEGEPWKAHDATGLAETKFFTDGPCKVIHKEPHAQGRWPANLILDEEAAALLDEQSGERKSGGRIGTTYNGQGAFSTSPRPSQAGKVCADFEPSTGGASRFFLRVSPDEACPVGKADEPLRMRYVSKASKRDRDEGLEGMEMHETGTMDGGHIVSEGRTAPKTGRVMRHNHHPTVKPTSLMRWLVRLITPPNGTVLDCFCGSGSTGKAAVLEGFSFVGIDKEAEYLEIARRRVEQAQMQMPLLEMA